jgi:hypothetical protein
VPPAVAEAREQHLSDLEVLDQLKAFETHDWSAENENLLANAKAKEKAKADG